MGNAEILVFYTDTMNYIINMTYSFGHLYIV